MSLANSYIWTKRDSEENLGICLNKPSGQIILSKEKLRTLLKKGLKIILEKWQNGVSVWWSKKYVYNSKWSEKLDIEYFESLIDKFLDQEIWELIWNTELAEKWLIKAVPFGYSEWQDLRFLFYTIFQNMEVSDFSQLWEEAEILRSVIPSIKRILTRRLLNRKANDILNHRIEWCEALVEDLPKLFWWYRKAWENIQDEWRDNENAPFIWPRNKWEVDISIDSIFYNIFHTCLGSMSKEIKNHYSKITDCNDRKIDFWKIYSNIVNPSARDNVSNIELVCFLDLVVSLSFVTSFRISRFTKILGVLDAEKIKELFKIWKYDSLHDSFMAYILPKIYRTQAIKIIKSRQDNQDEYFTVKELSPEITSIDNWIEIYTFGGNPKNLNSYLVVNWKILREFSWFDANNITKLNGNIYIKVNIWNSWAYINCTTWNSVYWEFDNVWEIQDWVDGDKVFWAKRWNRQMYISLRTWKPIEMEFDKAGPLQKWADWDIVFKVKYGSSETYVSLKENWLFLWKSYFASVSDIIIELSDWDRCFEAYPYERNNVDSEYTSPSSNPILISLSTGKEITITQKLRERFNKLDWPIFNLLRK